MKIITERELKEKISIRLKAERRKIDKSQQEIADILEQTRPAYARYEQGLGLPQALGIARMASVFNVSADYMLGLSNTREPGISDLNNYSPEAVHLLKVYDKLDKETQTIVNSIINLAVTEINNE